MHTLFLMQLFVIIFHQKIEKWKQENYWFIVYFDNFSFH